MGGSEVWESVASGAVLRAGVLVQDMAPLLIVFVGIAAFGLVVYVVRRVAS